MRDDITILAHEGNYHYSIKHFLATVLECARLNGNNIQRTGEKGF